MDDESDQLSQIWFWIWPTVPNLILSLPHVFIQSYRPRSDSSLWMAYVQFRTSSLHIELSALLMHWACFFFCVKRASSMQCTICTQIVKVPSKKIYLNWSFCPSSINHFFQILYYTFCVLGINDVIYKLNELYSDTGLVWIHPSKTFLPHRSF